ncbi:DNA-directed RNA polymerase subunit alpha [Candidatus Aerophobetes bacterium]|uniref:DNA-directed RNA polymerase subunit alpha n=1 Tax=Aerophobetes bacterium TaxID=2030807 RepID=A0A2A4YN12_UNCAE|nr:MAG: DNA-directed RNA polymerase subunit alpha [Candidatus Aerophobetes bacterium]
MTVKYGKFELPTKIKLDDKDKTDTFARFIAEPFERGFGHTIGNALRRIMLTSMEAPAIISVKFEGVPHEYMAIEGVIEDVTHIVLNLKSALLRKLPLEGETSLRGPITIPKDFEVTQEMLTASNGQYAVTLKEIMGDMTFDIVNPDLHIFTVTQPMKKKVFVKVAIGRGYVPSERHDLEHKVVDEIVLDSAFSPVALVNYFVENTRVGQDTDFDRLVLEVTTDGRITPHEALTFATQIGIHHFQVFDEIRLQDISFDLEEQENDSDKDVILSKLALKINEIELSVRSTNCLSQANIDTIAELVVMPESDMLRFRNFGKKSLNEIKAKLEEMGLHLGMDLSRYGINKDNVREIVQEYLNDKLGKET